jgi:hypothetical protein
MQSNTARVLVGIAAVAAAVVLLLVLKDDGGDDPTGDTTTAAEAKPTDTGKGDAGQKKPAKPAVPTIVIRDGKPVGGIAEISVDEGERVRFKVRSDVAEEIHVHGYDIAKEVGAGGTVGFDFPATIEGIFEAELEHLGEQILELTVNP